MSFTVLFLLVLTAFITVIFVYPYLWSLSYNRVKSILLCLAIYLFTVGVGGYGMYLTITGEETTLSLVLGLVPTFGFIIFAIYATVQYYSRGYGRRRAGQRLKPFAFRQIIYPTYGIIALLVIYGYWTEQIDGTNLFRLLVFSGMLSLADLDKVFKKQHEEEKQEAIRGAVLFIRSFRTDRKAFWMGSNFHIPKELPDDNSAILLRYSFTEYLSSTFAQYIGPLNGLGNPQDSIPVKGLAVSYQEDDNWQKVLSEQLDICSIIVMSVGQSANLKWELEQIKERKLTDKLFLLIPPKRPGIYKPFQAIGLSTFLAKWDTFCKEMAIAGYQLPAQKPVPGTIFAFDRRGDAHLMAIGAYSPTDYVSAIVEHARAVGVEV
ncbi:MAG TPA: hypothetical protein VJ933_06955 [Phaeodactylibacter sp.]|nr:hypothetical protein [Phaeodactylibacter sp.]